MSETRTYKFPNGKSFTIPFVLIDDYHYIKIKKADILAQLPVVLKSVDEQLSPLYVTWHWTAGNYDYPFNHYQVNVGEDYILVSLFLTSYESFSHTWMRNGRNLGISYMAMGGSVSGGMYDQDIRKVPGMMETGSLTLAVLKEHFKLSWDQVTDHAAWANKDGYPGERWDNQLELGNGFTVYSKTLSSAKWYWENKIKNIKSDQADPKHNVSDDQKHKNIEKSHDVCESDTVFCDVLKANWYADAIQKLYDLKIISGEKKADALYYRPKDSVLRAEMACVLEKVVDYIEKKKNITLDRNDKTSYFSDIPETAWYKKGVDAIVSMGLMVGTSKGIFTPNKVLTRAEAAVVTCRLISNAQIPVKVKQQQLTFNDVTKTDWFYGNVQTLYSMGIMVGKKDKELGYVFKPDDPITRAEIAVLLDAVLKQF